MYNNIWKSLEGKKVQGIIGNIIKEKILKRMIDEEKFINSEDNEEDKSNFD